MTIYRRLFWSGGWTNAPGECADCDVPIVVGDEVAWRQDRAYQVEVETEPGVKKAERRQDPPVVKHRKCAERERNVRIFEPCASVGDETFARMTQEERDAYLAAWETPTEEPVP